jgi:DNA-binding IclR family transcriptional regulator
MASKRILGENIRTQVQSLDRGLQLLEALSLAREPLGLPELAELLHVDRSTVHRLLGTLTQRGYARQDPDSKRYSIGLKVVELSRRALDGLSLRAVAKPHIKRLVQQTGESVNLAVVADGQIICIDHDPSPLALAVTNDIGVPFAPHATAIGKVLLAHLNDSQREALLDPGPYAVFTPRTITHPDALRMSLNVIRQQGYALDDEERFIGVRCLAAPVRDHRSKVVAALSLSGPTARVTLEKVPAFAKLVVETADQVSAALGFVPA